MSTRLCARTVVRLVAAGATILSIGCAASPSEPVVTRGIQARNASSHDDSPPPEPCRSGWTQTNGRWTCSDI